MGVAPVSSVPLHLSHGTALWPAYAGIVAGVVTVALAVYLDHTRWADQPRRADYWVFLGVGVTLASLLFVWLV